MAPYEALFCRRCRSPIRLSEVVESSILCPNLIYKTLEKIHIIRNQLKKAYGRQKTYAYNRRRDLEFKEGDNVYLIISPMKGVVRFGMKGKLSPWYVASYEISQWVCKLPMI